MYVPAQLTPNLMRISFTTVPVFKRWWALHLKNHHIGDWCFCIASSNLVGSMPTKSKPILHYKDQNMTDSWRR